MDAGHYTDSARCPLAGRTALVTGGARRLGAAVVRHLSDLGARVIVHCFQSQDEAEALVASLKTAGAVARANLAIPEGAEHLYAQLATMGESPDLLVHAAAGFVRADLRESDAALWDRVLALNLRSFALLAREMERQRGTRGGDLIAIADAAALELWPGYLAHSVAKAGLLALVKALAKGLAPAYRVNAIVPGPVLLPEDTPEAEAEQIRRRTLLERLGSPVDVARAVAYLAGASFSTGAVVHVTGGSELWRGRT